MKKTAKIIIGLLLAAIGLPASAQRAQDALYIFRNDGQFNAFFWGDIQRFAYSKVDTLGVEHDDYVVQEVYALDSVFRIPVSAIDSIAFVTPENKVKSDVVIPDKSIADYIVASDSLYWIRLAPGTPQALIPKKGDKLLIEQKSRYIPDGFGGLVTSVKQGTDGYTVSTEELELKDVYDVLVLKSSGVPRDGAASSRRAASDADFSYETTDPIELPALTGGISLLSGQYKMLPDNTPVQISLDGSLDFSGTLQSTVDLRCFLYLNTLCNQDRYYQVAKFDNSIDVSLALTGALTAHADVPFTFLKDLVKEGAKYALKEGGKKLAVDMGPFWADFSFGLYFEGQGTVTSSYTWSNKHTINTTYQYDRNILWGTWEDFYRYNYFVGRDTTTWTIAAGKLALSTGLYAQAEVACNVPIVKKKGSVALRFDAGLKTEFDAPIFTDDAYLPLIDTPNLYSDLNFDETVTLSIPVNLSFAANFGQWAWTPKLSFSLMKPISFGIVPNISSPKWHDEKYEPYRFTVESPVSRSLIIPVPIGFAVFDIDDKQTEDFWYTSYLNDRVLKSYKHVFETLDPRKDEGTVYTIFPQIRYMGHPVLVGKGEEISIGKARIDISEKRIAATEDMSHQTVSFVPNMKNVELKSDASWLTFIRFDSRGELSAYWEALPANVPNRKATIFVTGKTKDGEVLVEDSIVVQQARLVFKTSPAKLTFDAKGGTQTVTITETNLTDITVGGNGDYVRATISDKTITVTVSPNTGSPYDSFITVEGKLPTGDKATAFIDFSQDGNYEPGPAEGEAIPVETFRCRIVADGLKCTSSSDTNPKHTLGIGEGPTPEVWGVNYEDKDEDEDLAQYAPQRVKAVATQKAIHVVAHADDEEITTYRDTNSPIYDMYPLAGKRTYTLEFDIEKYRNDQGKPAARVTNVTLTDDRRLDWDDGDYELHHLSAQLDPGKLQTQIGVVTDFDFVDGKIVIIPIGYSEIEVGSFGYGVEGLDVGLWNYDFTYHYRYWGDNEWYRYDASYQHQDASKPSSFYMKIAFPQEVQQTVKEWFEKAN